MPASLAPFSIRYSGGRVSAISLPADYTLAQRSTAKAWAANWQMATDRDEPFFTSTEAGKLGF